MANFDNFEQKESFDFGRVFGRAFLALRRNFLAFFVTAIIIIGIPTFLTSLWTYSTIYGFSSDTQIPQISAGLVSTALIAGVVAMIATSILQGAVTYGAVRDFNDEPASWREMLSVGLRFALPLIGFGILSGLGIAVGMILLLIPGLILACMWIVGVPALIMEKTGVSGAFERTTELTRGYRWWMLLALVVYIVIAIAIGLVQELVLLPFGLGESAFFSGNVGLTSMITMSTFDSLFQVLLSILATLGVASLYYELRYVKEGVYPESIVSVFD